jgi:hypothetical protein
MKIEGRCHCGAIQYEAEVDPATVSICHCDDCQTLSGAPFRASVPAKTENFQLTGGLPKIYVKTAASGNKRAQAFCADCGSSIYSADAVDHPAVYMLRVGPIEQREQLPPKRQIWHSSALAWASDTTELESHPRGVPPKA